MGFLADINARNALVRQSKGKSKEAVELYEKALKGGLTNPRYLLAYSILLIRDFKFKEAKSIILKAEKSSGLTEDQKIQIYVNYAICELKLGEKDKAIRVLEKMHARQQSGLIYETLGYMYIDTGNWEKALDYNTEALKYDDEDSVVLDNMGQYYYRNPNADKAKAKEYFEKALKEKPSQIDTNYYLAMYDIEEGKKEEAIEKLETAAEGKFSPLNNVTKEEVEKLIKELQAK